MKNFSFNIAEKKIGQSCPTFIIAEIGQAHDGSLGSAHSYIDAASEAGVDAIKFQTHFASEESSKYDQFRVNFSYQDATRYDYWKRLEFTDEQWAGLKKHCDEKSIIFLSSAFSNKAVDLLTKLEVAAWKVASGEINNTPMLEKMLLTGRPLIVSNGLCTQSEIVNLKKMCDNSKTQFAVLQCTSQYPCEPESIDILNIKILKENLICPTGLSDHSGTIYPSMAAMSLGADLLEVHVTFDKNSFGPDSTASLTFDELKKLVEAKDYFYRLFTKVDISEDRQELRTLFGKSFYAARNIEPEEVFSWNNVELLKPVIGIKAKDYKRFLGAYSNKKILAGEPIYLQDMKDEKA